MENREKFYSLSTIAVWIAVETQNTVTERNQKMKDWWENNARKRKNQNVPTSFKNAMIFKQKNPQSRRPCGFVEGVDTLCCPARALFPDKKKRVWTRTASRLSLVAEAGLEPATSGLWARRNFPTGYILFIQFIAILHIVYISHGFYCLNMIPSYISGRLSGKRWSYLKRSKQIEKVLSALFLFRRKSDVQDNLYRHL